MRLMKSARLYQCVRCHCQCVVCSDCDRGNIYCGFACAAQSRAQNHRIANRIYQKTFRGSQKHADRQRNYRLRQKQKVTDQGSTNASSNDLLPTATNDNKKTMSEKICCHFCGKNVSPYLRNGYLRYHMRPQKNKLIHLRDTG